MEVTGYPETAPSAGIVFLVVNSPEGGAETQVQRYLHLLGM